MDKSVIFAVAGAGKTTHLVSSLDEERRFLIITYTQANYNNIRTKIINRFGYLPANIIIFTYFSFLHGFCYKPFLRQRKNTRGIIFDLPPIFPRYSSIDDRRYITKNRYLYSNRVAKLLEKENLYKAINHRLERYFDVLLVDEVQDFSGHDFNFLLAISESELTSVFVGDFYQHTFDTSRDGNVNSNLHLDFEAYQQRFRKANFNLDNFSLKFSRRCSKTVCDFITDRIGISIQSSGPKETTVKYLDDQKAAHEIYRDPNIVKLFLKEHYKFGCFSNNWGGSKGIDSYQDVCVVLNPSNVKAWESGSFLNINPETRNKLYVACSRARRDLFFVPEKLLSTFKTTSKRT
ncbi:MULTISPECIES: AAA family ATPase [Brucella]|uniref:DNA helicase-2/ATP-dependent DNA helicase PcrA n=1 Tax=Brucella daejeonensis TaxID=659015 RepID=A0A7W9AWF0_9HYPH|nr:MULTISPECIES: AAA family ATPase [Brucella]KAB2684759.1 AAA family ATPase [Brucella pseudintermedia]MBB5701479.1 DNA helicase-2/ATP-dependent DNA helicase PcrA [Brucella daejeonensis]